MTCLRVLKLIMTKDNYFFKIFVLSIALTTNAYAYVDGGTALLLLQGTFAAIGAALVFLKKPWALISKIFSRNKNKDA